ncbi:hypothetical protein [Vampirovibrio sp.]|uniref:hypothetical protein n=1 Tax=Vampirovibrio sp. TaxID=2717857 RepID=UPI0035942033
MRPNQHPYRHTPHNQPKVIAISATRSNILPTLAWQLGLAGLLYSLLIGLVQ